MRVIPDNQIGFTLIEIMIAITIFSIGLLAIAGLQINAINFNTGSNDRTAAVAIAQKIMEEIRSWDSGSINARTAVANAGWDLDPDPLVFSNTITLPGSGTFTATYSVAVNAPRGGLSTVTVNVTGPQNRVTTMTGFKRYHF